MAGLGFNADRVRAAARATPGVAPRVALVRLGCRVSQSDAEAVLEACGARPPAGGADAVLVSTCVVTADAESTALQAVRRAARDHPGVPIVVIGCAGALLRRELARLDGVAAVLGPGEVEEAARALVAAVAARRGAGSGANGAAGYVDATEVETSRATAALLRARPTLKIQDGCDRRCAYCVVPLARGRSRSMPLAAALERVEALGRGADEVVLAGVHLGAYGADLRADKPEPGVHGASARGADGAPPPSLGALISAIAERRLVHRVRLSSLDPLEVPLEVLSGPAAEIVCGQLHLPLQSGSARVLARMRRPYSAREVSHVVERISRAMSGACIAADVMTGFPGETDADHRATVELVRALPIAALHVFTFSPRAGTDAATMPDQVPAALAKERAAELREVSARAWMGYVDGLAGREVEAIVERVAGGEARGTTREGVLARWRVGDEGAPPRGRAARLRAIAREGEALRCERT
ncbi:MAG TPA: MiaB/RimO family radical SAM methylthiotransferase [Anaeromyxobacteraceae bacterium]|nr:MiaB/RimO family radical SAM methylthiotransferase [Anaeromyxobacteraceae bacterium]